MARTNKKTVLKWLLCLFIVVAVAAPLNLYAQASRDESGQADSTETDFG